VNNKMEKNSRVELRVKEKDLELCRSLFIKYSDVWDIGMEHIYKNMSKYADKLYVQKTEIETNVRTVVDKADSRQIKLDELVKAYTSNRDVEHPDKQDVSWIESRAKGIDGLTVNGFLNYCKFKKEGG
jgi:hypothetical protein